MLYGDDICSTVSIISSAFSELDEEENVETTVVGEPDEYKYVPPVKTEVEEDIPPLGALTDDTIDDHFLISFNNNEDGEGDGGGVVTVVTDSQAGVDKDLAGLGLGEKLLKQKKVLPPGTARRGGIRKQMTRVDMDKQRLHMKEKRMLMTPEEKEKEREKDRMRKQKTRKRKNEEISLQTLVESDDEVVGGKGRRRPRRQAARLDIKYEPESGEEDDHQDDDDYQLDDEDEEYGKKKPKPKRSVGRPKGRSKSSASVKEQGGGKKRGRKRQLKEEIKTEDDEEGQGESKKKKGRRRRRRSSESGGGARRRSSGSRKKIGEMTEEEREAIKAKWREEARLKRARQRETMTPAEREAYLAKQREQRRQQRAMAKVTMSEMEREEENRKARERKKAKRALMTPEQRREEAQKVTLRRIERLANMNEDEKKMYRMNNYLQNMARAARMTPEEIEKRRQAKQEYSKKRRALMTPEDLERRRLMIKRYRDNMDPDRKARFLEKLRECYRRRVAKLKEDPDKWEEVKKKWKESRLEREKRLKEEGLFSDGDADMDPLEEGIKKRRRRKRKEGEEQKRRYRRRRNENETEEERRERIRQSKRRTQKKIKLRKKLTMQRLLDSGMSIEEINQQMETPQQRENRLIRQRINKAKLDLKKRLEKVGAPPEEIEQKVQELQKTYTPTFAFRPYKPRPDSWKPIDPNDLALLEEVVEQKPELVPVPSTSTTTITTPPTKAHKAGTSKVPKTEPPSTPTTPKGRRGRPPKFSQEAITITPTPPLAPPPPIQPVVQSLSQGTTVIISRGLLPPQPQQLPQPIQPQQIILATYPQPVSSPAGASTCSYVSAAETPEPPTHYSAIVHPQQFATPHTTQQTYPHHQQQYQIFQQTPAGYTNQPQSQSQAYSLQHILDSITFHETGVQNTTGTATLIAHQVTYPEQQVQQQQQVLPHQTHPPHHETSSHHDYASSYDNHSPPPSSPGGGGDDHDYTYGDYNSSSFNQNQQAPQSTLSTDSSNRKRGRPRKGDPPVIKKPKRPRCGPRGPKKSTKSPVVRDMVCDECGNAYNSAYLREHKNQFHNPNYKNQTCLLCGEKFTVARVWYTHYIRTHVTPTKSAQEKPHMCDICGVSFRNKNNMYKHKHFMHGDGLKKENFKRCPVCPDEKLFKETVSLYAHLRRKHPEYKRQTNDCYRCENSFPNEQSLSSHVKEQHPDSYYPCKYCNACRFTQYGLNFHYFRCTKVTKEMRDDLRKTEGVYSLDRVPLPCEFCERNVAVFSLTRHYWEMHNVKEDNFTCPFCGKEFRVREFWAVHMEEKHLKTLDQMKELVRSLNVRSREGLEIKNKDGVKGGVPGNTPSKAAAQKRIEMGVAKTGGRPRKPGTGRGRGGSRTGGGRALVKVGRRAIAVVAEEEDDDEDEDLDENSMSFSEGERGESSRSSSINTNKRRRRIVVVAEEEEGEDGEVGEELVQKRLEKLRRRERDAGRLPRRRPGPKSKTRRRTEEDDFYENVEEEDEEWKGSDEEEGGGGKSAGGKDEESRSSFEGSRRSRSTRVRSKPKRLRDDDEENSEEEEELEEEPNYEVDDRGVSPSPVDEDELLEAVVKQEILSDGDEERDTAGTDGVVVEVEVETKGMEASN